MKKITFLLLLLSYCCFGQNNEKIVRKYLESLTPYGGLLDTSDVEDIDDFLYQQVISDTADMANALLARVEPIDLKPILYKKLYNSSGVEVIIQHNSTANKALGRAFCSNGSPLIILASNPGKKISPYSLAFFKYHEYAHHLLGSAGCSDGEKSGPKQEMDADCLASELLQEYFPNDGTSIIYHVTGTLFALNKRRTSTHPSSADRAMQLLKGKEGCTQWPPVNDD